MFAIKSRVITATLAATAAIPIVTAGVFTSAGSAQAAILKGSIGLNGTSIVPSDGINPKNTSITFVDVDGVDTEGDFANFSPNLDSVTTPIKGISINTLKLTKISNLPSISKITRATYSTGNVFPFINFGTRTLNSTTAVLTFDLDDAVITRTRTSSTNISDVTLDGITGKFNFDGKTVATGFVTASLSGTRSTYQLTLTAEPVSVPEPSTMLGLGLFGTFIAASRLRKAQAISGDLSTR
ncbi:PEP-CTERM sorting domain-containing protein [Calothrix sp. FACHB-1219]|uniref:PEP-CTERM sorting domain-containing protein n=1 Tax=unclassified Calothrix TaxID=2619626 RepID=UPI001684C093|nr:MULTISPECIES: PEP-CTERM sorting domain-containing protein [unclassified Calothrix]MBD2204254.1 PEP-CTERM sorting domain-containing protein [Calothrix sp. FACHB-168]MBD2220560.1 PEP-CTERM sorting domain-containing protein [Calothrix sp. FACHB-1219]